MKNYLQYTLILACIYFTSCRGVPDKTPVQLVQSHLETISDSLDMALFKLNQTVTERRPSSDLQRHFEKARVIYKYLEPFTELYFPGFSEAINGPAIDESEMYEGKVVEASGFQVVEEYLYPETDTAAFQNLIIETELLASVPKRLKQLIADNELTDAHIFQAIRLQLIRVSSLGLSGFDSPIAKRSIPEAAASLRGIQHVLNLYGTTDNPYLKSVNENFEHAYDYLVKESDFNSFDRATFIADNIIALSTSIYRYQQALGISNRDLPAAVNLNEANFFGPNTFNLSHFSNPANKSNKRELVELGKLLFFDPVLSGNNQRACASCHQPSKAFSDGRAKSLAFEGKGEVTRNAPTVINTAYQRMQFYDSRTMFQEDQVTDVVSNVQELHGRMEEAVLKIKKSSEYQELFDDAFGVDGKEITARQVQMALASYVRSLSSLSADFDRYMRGDKSAMNAEAVSGFNVFMGKAKCGTCHFMPLFNGTIPPLYMKSESEVLGVPINADTSNAKEDPDLGKFLIFGGDLNRHAFKTPTLRNVALTAPYMHNGVYGTLEEVIDFYNRGGGEGIGVHLPNQTLPTEKLDLTSQEKEMLIAFMRALTDTTGLSSVPKRLPAFDDPGLKNRRTGGVY